MDGPNNRVQWSPPWSTVITQEKYLKDTLWLLAIRDKHWGNILILYHKYMRHYGYDFYRILTMERHLTDLLVRCPQVYRDARFIVAVYNLVLLCNFCRDWVRACPEIRAYPHRGQVDVDPKRPVNINLVQLRRLLALIRVYANTERTLLHKWFLKLQSTHRNHINHQLYFEQFFYCIYYFVKNKLSPSFKKRIQYTMATLHYIYSKSWIKLIDNRYTLCPLRGRSHISSSMTSAAAVASQRQHLYQNVVLMSNQSVFHRPPRISEREIIQSRERHALIDTLVSNIVGIVEGREKLAEI